MPAALLLAQTPPAENLGLTVSGQDALPLGPQIPAMEGYQARIRTVAMAPDAIVGFHGHLTRPGAFYVAKGTVVEYRGSTQTVVGEGEAVLEDIDTEHWVENKSGEPATLFVFDIVPIE